MPDLSILLTSSFVDGVNSNEIELNVDEDRILLSLGGETAFVLVVESPVASVALGVTGGVISAVSGGAGSVKIDEVGITGEEKLFCRSAALDDAAELIGLRNGNKFEPANK